MHICFLDIDGTLVSTGGAGQAAFRRNARQGFRHHRRHDQRRGVRRPQRPRHRPRPVRALRHRADAGSLVAVSTSATSSGSKRSCRATTAASCPASFPSWSNSRLAATWPSASSPATSAKRPAASSALRALGLVPLRRLRRRAHRPLRHRRRRPRRRPQTSQRQRHGRPRPDRRHRRHAQRHPLRPLDRRACVAVPTGQTSIEILRGGKPDVARRHTRRFSRRHGPFRRVDVPPCSLRLHRITIYPIKSLDGIDGRRNRSPPQRLPGKRPPLRPLRRRRPLRERQAHRRHPPHPRHLRSAEHDECDSTTPPATILPNSR